MWRRLFGRRGRAFPAKLSSEQVEAVRALAQDGLGVREIAQEVGISVRSVKRILGREKGGAEDGRPPTLMQVLEAEKVRALQAAFNDPEVARKYQERLLDSILPLGPDTGNLAIRPEDEEDDLEVLERQVEGLRRLKELSAEFGPQGSGWGEGLRALAQILSSPNLAYLVGQGRGVQLPSPVSPPPAPLASPEAPQGPGAGGVGAISPPAVETPPPGDLEALLAELKAVPPERAASILADAASQDELMAQWLGQVVHLLSKEAGP